MIKVKGGKTKNDEFLGKALGLSGPALAKQIGMPSAQPKAPEAKKIVNPMIRSKDDRKKKVDDEKEISDSDFDSDLDVSDDDTVMQNLRAKRIAELRAAQAEKQTQTQKGHGLYLEIKEDEFLPTVTSSDLAIVHFYHNEFEKCKVIDRHLSVLAKVHRETRFVKLNAEKAQFFADKLKIMTLPTVVTFKNGVAKERLVGFQELGMRDDFTTRTVEKKLIEFKAIQRRDNDSDDEESDEEKEDKNVINVAKEMLR